MVFMPSTELLKDLLDAFELKILTDGDYVIKCLQEVGLDTSKLSLAAREIIIEDFRKFHKPLMKIDRDVTDTFKGFVNDTGNYSRTIPYLEIGTLELVANDDGTFVVKTNRNIGDNKKVEIGFYSSVGIELKREFYLEGFPSFGLITRNENLVTFTIQTFDRETKNKVKSEETFFVAPLINRGRTLELGAGYTRFSERFVREERSNEERDTITEYLQLITGLSPMLYTKNGEPITHKVAEDDESLYEELTVDYCEEITDFGMGL